MSTVFTAKTTSVALHLRSVVPAPGVTHLHYDIRK
jgi:hypothetical protein